MATSTMMSTPLTVTQLLRHGARVHGEREVVTWQGESARRVTFADTNERVERLAGALDDLGIGEGDVVGTFMWNNQEHHRWGVAPPSCRSRSTTTHGSPGLPRAP